MKHKFDSPISLTEELRCGLKTKINGFKQKLIREISFLKLNTASAWFKEVCIAIDYQDRVRTINIYLNSSTWRHLIFFNHWFSMQAFDKLKMATFDCSKMYVPNLCKWLKCHPSCCRTKAQFSMCKGNWILNWRSIWYARRFDNQLKPTFPILQSILKGFKAGIVLRFSLALAKNWHDDTPVVMIIS